MPRIIRRSRRARRPRLVHQRAHALDARCRARRRSPRRSRKWPILSSTMVGDRRDRADRVEARARGRHGIRGRAPRRAAAAATSRSSSRSRAAPVGLAIGAGMQLDDRRAQAPSPPRAARGSGSMNSETRMPAAPSSRDEAARDASSPPAASSPPSVVSSARFSGTMQAACGRWLQRDREHLVGRRHLEVERQVDLAREPGDVVVARCGGGPRADAR